MVRQRGGSSRKIEKVQPMRQEEKLGEGGFLGIMRTKLFKRKE